MDKPLTWYREYRTFLDAFVRGQRPLDIDERKAAYEALQETLDEAPNGKRSQRDR